MHQCAVSREAAEKENCLDNSLGYEVCTVEKKRLGWGMAEGKGRGKRDRARLLGV